jgi:hypothetical protein
MDHSYIDEHNVVARYGMGKLSSEESARFEEHFVDCPQCLEQLETTHDLKQAFRTLVAEDAAHTGFIGTPAKPLRRASAGWRPGLVALAACLLVIALSAVLLVRQLHFGRTALVQANAAAENWHRQYVTELETNADLKKQLGETERNGQQKPNLAGALSRSPVAALAFTLETVRGTESPGGEPVNQLEIPRSVQSITLSIDREDLQDSQSYDATLTDSHGRVVGQLNGLSPSAGISVPSDLLHQGNYLLTVKGRSRDGVVLVSRIYPFRVKSRP